MPKSKKPKNQPSLREAIKATLPWSHTLSGNTSDIEAYIKATGIWETIACVNSLPGIDAEDLAAFIVEGMNQSNEKDAAVSAKQ